MLQHPGTTSAARARALSSVGGALLAALTGCGSDLGRCDKSAAQELVYGKNATVATKGQALMHDTCGNAAFCHSSQARGKARHGVPKGLDFDMLPSPRGLATVLDHREAIWETIESRFMPPPGARSLVGDGEWSFDIQRRPEAPTLPPLSSKEGKAVLRNWLACGAPTVTDTRVPSWAQPAQDPFASDEPVTWRSIYEVVMRPSCATGGCHDAVTAAGGLTMRDPCQARSALLATGACQQTILRPGNAAESLLIDKLDNTEPSCGDSMPPTGQLSESARRAIRSWVNDGALAEECSP